MAILLGMLQPAPHASAQTAEADDAPRRAAAVRAADRTCRQEISDASADVAGRPTAVAAFVTRVLDPEPLCTCMRRRFRLSLESGKVDPRDLGAVADLFETELNACLFDGFVDNFRGYCDALFVAHYGEDVLEGPHANSIARFCDCTRSKLRIPADGRLEPLLGQTPEILDAYRTTGELDDRHDGSLTSAMAACGIVDLKRTLFGSKRFESRPSESGP